MRVRPRRRAGGRCKCIQNPRYPFRGRGPSSAQPGCRSTPGVRCTAADPSLKWPARRWPVERVASNRGGGTRVMLALGPDRVVRSAISRARQPDPPGLASCAADGFARAEPCCSCLRQRNARCGDAAARRTAGARAGRAFAALRAGASRRVLPALARLRARSGRVAAVARAAHRPEIFLPEPEKTLASRRGTSIIRGSFAILSREPEIGRRGT